MSRLAALAGGLALIASSVGCDIYFGEKDPQEVKEECLADLNSSPNVDRPSFPLELGPTVQLAKPPPPVSGGTMALTPDERTVVIGDSDRDRIYLVSLETRTLLATLVMAEGDEPGRIATDDAGRAYVALRGGGAIAVIDVTTGTLLRRDEACAAPRGVTLDSVTGSLLVACHGGELVSLDPATGAILNTWMLDNGLRDVVADADHIYVTKFRTAEALVLDRTGQVSEIIKPPGIDSIGFDGFTGEEVEHHFEPAVAWRTIPAPGGGVIMLHQRAREGSVKPEPGGYGGDRCLGGVTHAAITRLKAGQTPIATEKLTGPVLPVDIALVFGGDFGVVVSAGNGAGEFATFPPVERYLVGQPLAEFSCAFGEPYEIWQGQPISAVSTSTDTVAVQLREPAELHIFENGDMWTPIVVPLETESVFDTGHALFHMDTGAGIACASCHPEANDDGRVWDFECIGPRRTQSLRFGIKGTEPLHWDGDMDTFGTLMNEVFVGRMSGGQPQPDQVAVMADWLDAQRPPPRSPPADPAAVERGRDIFARADVGCAACHTGPKLTNNASFDVGTGGVFQVPSLIGIADRAPFIHTGCAPTLRARLVDPACGGGDRHGVVSGLTGAEIDDLVAFLKTL